LKPIHHTIFVAAILVVLSLLCPGVALAEPKAQHVFIVSLDGGKPAVMHESPMPFLNARVAEGAVTWQAQTVFPSITLVSHTSMLTGVGPEKHKVNWNDWVPSRGLVNVPTVFTLAKKAGFSTALFAAKEKFIHLNSPGALDGFGVLEMKAPALARTVAAYIVERKPNLCFIHFADSDSAGHRHGWGSPEQIQSFADEDTGLQIINDAIVAAGIADSSVIIVSADHGGHAKTHGSNSPEDMTIPWIAWGAGVEKGRTIDAPVTTYDTAATALWLLGVALPTEWDGKPVESAFNAEAIAK
jgi:predicted AlkP superfamily pyrophosphatase or phosphodiesterase